MNDLCADIGYKSINHVGEELCGDHVDVVEENGNVVATFMFSLDGEPTYAKIYEGEWLNDAPYGVIHRIAVAEQGRGIIGFCIDECFKHCQNLRIDTHRDNIPMQRALKKFGFSYAGIIHLASGDERLAYEIERK